MMRINKNNYINWLLLGVIFLGGCMMPLKPVTGEGGKTESEVEPMSLEPVGVWGGLANYLSYYEGIGGLSAAGVDEEVLRQLQAAEEGVRKANLYLALLYIHPETAAYDPVSARKKLTSLAEEGGVSDAGLGVFVSILNDITASQKSFEIMAARKNNELAVAGHKIKNLEQDVHKYKKEAALLAAQIEELKNIEKLIIKRQSTKP